MRLTTEQTMRIREIGEWQVDYFNANNTFPEYCIKFMHNGILILNPCDQLDLSNSDIAKKVYKYWRYVL